jgi:gamma-glutamyl-gamma-aminobutyrate hydrolase PuuD
MILKNKIVLQAWNDSSVTDLMHDLGCAVTHDVNSEYDLAVFTGGADISPYFYGEKPIDMCGNILFHRDKHEINILHQIPFGTPVLGICRGAQLLNCQAGGKLYQHVNNHGGGQHEALVTKTGQLVTVNTIHHQMMRPPKHAQMLLQAGRSTIRYAENLEERITFEGKKDWTDVEATWIPHHNYLCFQGHPEYAHRSSDTRRVWESFIIDNVLPVLNS